VGFVLDDPDVAPHTEVGACLVDELRAGGVLVVGERVEVEGAGDHREVDTRREGAQHQAAHRTTGPVVGPEPREDARPVPGTPEAEVRWVLGATEPANDVDEVGSPRRPTACRLPDPLQPEEVDEDVGRPVVAHRAHEGDDVQQRELVDVQSVPQSGVGDARGDPSIQEQVCVEGPRREALGEFDEHEDLADTCRGEQQVSVVLGQRPRAVTDTEVDDRHRPLRERVETSRQRERRAEPGAGHSQRGAIRSAPSIRIVSPLR